MGNLQRLAMQMQQEMTRIQAELAESEVQGTAGGGVVRAVATGTQQLRSVTIDPAAVDPADVGMLEDLVTAAVNDALDASRKLAEQKMSALGGLGAIGGGLGGLLGR
jgi:nucleoid-associated protein EbfC